MSKIDLSGLRTAEQKAETAARADQERINAMARQYLSDTDWYETREHREGKPIPTEVLESRRKARAAVIEISPKRLPLFGVGIAESIQPDALSS